MESTIKWQKGTPTIGGEYLVCLKDGSVITDKFLAVDGLEGDWRKFNKSYVVAWCKLSDIKPYSKKERIITQKNKELLLRDLCCRLPYGVKCENYNHVYGKNIFKVTDIRDNGYICGIINNKHGWAVFDLLELKPYLFPMSSMNEEQKIIYGDLCYAVIRSFTWDTQDALNELYSWLNKNHFDYRGLIPLGLANDATNLNIY